MQKVVVDGESRKREQGDQFPTGNFFLQIPRTQSSDTNAFFGHDGASLAVVKECHIINYSKYHVFVGQNIARIAIAAQCRN